MRKLASIQKITSVSPIENADRIELAHVLGWQCVIKKDEFKAGDIGVYFEIDSFLPMDERYAFMESSHKSSPILGEGYLIRTQKFRGEISQGLLLPVTDFPELSGDDLAVGTDVSEKLGVREWQIPEKASGAGTIVGHIPGIVHVTDETRIQSCPELLEEFKGIPYYITTKIDGSSHTINVDQNGFHASGHNYEYKDDGKSSFYEYVKKNKIMDYLIALCNETGHYITVQGEWAGAGIQNNKLKLLQPEWYVFTADVDGKRVSWAETVHIARYIGAKTVPFEESGDDLIEKYPDEKALLERCAKDPTGIYKGGQPEGIVIRPLEPVYSPTLRGPLSMKVLNNKYLLKKKD